MIARISGTLLSKKPTVAIIDVNGVGYLLNISLNTFYSLPDEGVAVALVTHTHVREDQISLYGFIMAGEKETFERLITISGVGPKLAITILSGIPYIKLIGAIGSGDLAMLTSIPGVGKKTAQRLIVELKDKFADMGALADGETGPGHEAEGFDDAVEALVSLGYRKNDARVAVRKTLATDSGQDLETILKEALKKMG
ncbi:Holliday junction ATP-dependent DNA helicase RuvA [hydrothermal vent metagenome]|uniref:Holliday junction ATP-dependent DNA helicase RuvA n=1 Tax=hydrothermal vent metagenome TaxID=652676 RepID=A0A3B1C5V2_9ZZZZ